MYPCLYLAIALVTVYQCALNEQFMVATMPAADPTSSRELPLMSGPSAGESRNRVLKLLIRRMNSCRTFSENLIFMLNRASSKFDM
jgi:hypothetical protein